MKIHQQENTVIVSNRDEFRRDDWSLKFVVFDKSSGKVLKKHNCTETELETARRFMKRWRE